MNAIKSRRPMSLATFLKEASSQGSGIKYVPEKSKLHRMYIPAIAIPVVDEATNTTTTEVGPIAEMHFIHEWKNGDKFQSAECVKDRDGSCPFCDRVQDAWDIYRERYERAEGELRAQGMDEGQIQWQMRGEQDKAKRQLPNAYKGLYMTFVDELKMKDVKAYMYMLVALYDLDAAGNPIMENGKPKYQLKVMKLPEGRVKKLFDTFATQGGHIEGNEITIQYPNIDDRAQLVGQSTIAPVFPDYAFVKQYPGLKEKIDEEAQKFDMESIGKSFEELKQLEPTACKTLADSGFVKWDTYKAEKAVNPGAVYQEYSSSVAATAPQIGAAPAGMTFALPNAGAAPVPPVQPAVAPVQPPVQPLVQPPVQPQQAAVPPVQPVVPPVAPAQQAAAPVPPVTPQAGAPVNFSI